MLAFDPLGFPLHGQRLIEASAGTGKTFSIALLYLRLLLERRLDVDRILVVTFTTAATEELRTRISGRLHEALDQLERHPGGTGGKEADEILARLLAGVEDRQEAKTRLIDALARMDEAAVYTIHGFCQRMLQENAFESGALFDIEFLESEKPMRSRIIEDFWRRRFYSSPPEEARWAISTWNDPEGLEKNISGVLANPFVECLPEVSGEQVQVAKQKAEDYFRLVRQHWQECSLEVEDILRHDKCLSRNKKDGYSPERVELILNRMNSLEEDSLMPWILPPGLALLGASAMREKLVREKICPEHDFFAGFDAFFQAHSEFLRAARFHALAEARGFLLVELGRRKKSQARIYYDDLLWKLDQALSGPGEAGLAERIRSRFAAALIDEFQDTDPVQYRIVSRLFGTGPDPALFMIGDPKQAIYSFRGADIFTYIKARRDTPDTGCFTMAVNYRSTAAMVGAVNSLFAPGDSFVFAGDIVFHSVRAGGNADEKPLRLENKRPRPLQAMIIPSADGEENGAAASKSGAEEIATRWSAHEIARLLELGAEGKARLGEKNLAGGDLAVLVRTHAEAGLMQQALSRLGIASVYYSQDSVFASEEAGQLYRVLFALLDLSDENSLHSALVTDLFGLSGTDLHELIHNDDGRARLLAELQEYHTCWHKSGLTAMFQKMLIRRHIVQRLMAEQGGERKLTNFLHLVELLQDASAKLEGMESLVRWYCDQLHNPEPDKASQQLRLESDENLVRIITIHKAKGLEYPVVFLPYLWHARPVNKKAVFSFHEPGTGRILADLGTADPEHYRRAERERLAEDLRLLYVAVTRARHMCCFCWGKVKGMEAAPLAWLLHREEGEAVPAARMTESRILQDLTRLSMSGDFLDFLPWPSDFRRRHVSFSAAGEKLQPKKFAGRIDIDWAETSYSQMMAGSGDPELQEEVVPARTEPYREREKIYSPFGFPRGAAAGNCLHGLLEQIDFPVLDETLRPELVARHLAGSGIDVEWIPVVCEWLPDIVKTPLRETPAFRLMDIAGDERLVELGFYFSMQNIDAGKINRVLEDFSIPPVDFRQTYGSGLMKGYIDLVFRAAGRFFIADYKSNYLGPDHEDYRPQNLELAMREHRYDLQYLIYTVAVHRYLKTRVEGYRYGDHFGGVYYLFLRGMQPATGPRRGIYFTLPPQPLVESLDRCFGYQVNT
ncbi:MAG: exodeoxyribonuclease V subunit beta [Desulfobulbaceae bacterium]|nr:exodeoxyribonuclease V subunit beta [Desulfobulbaceae bacterium]